LLLFWRLRPLFRRRIASVHSDRFQISYDGVAGKVTDNPEADALLCRTYRPGWTLNG